MALFVGTFGSHTDAPGTGPFWIDQVWNANWSLSGLSPMLLFLGWAIFQPNISLVSLFCRLLLCCFGSLYPAAFVICWQPISKMADPVIAHARYIVSTSWIVHAHWHPYWCLRSGSDLILFRNGGGYERSLGRHHLSEGLRERESAYLSSPSASAISSIGKLYTLIDCCSSALFKLLYHGQTFIILNNTTYYLAYLLGKPSLIYPPFSGTQHWGIFWWSDILT